MAQCTISNDELSLILNKSRERLRAFHVTAVHVFGSCARKEAGEKSDVDLLIDFEPDAPIGLFDVVRLQEFLRSVLGRPVDIVTRDALHPALKDTILSEAVHVA